MDDQSDSSSPQSSKNPSKGGPAASQDTGSSSKRPLTDGSLIEDFTESTDPPMNLGKTQMGKNFRSHQKAVYMTDAELFMDAIHSNDKERVLEFIRRGIDLNVIYDKGETIIRAATVSSDNLPSRSLEIITILLDAEGATSTGSRLQDHLLEAATSSLDLAPDIITLLQRRGADVNLQLKGYYGSALAAAVGRGLPSTIRVLLDAGADVNLQLKGYYGSALAVAATGGSPGTIRVLLDAGADVNLQLEYGVYGSALAVAATRGSPCIIRALLEGGADVNMQLERGHYGSALVAAAADGSPGIIRALLEGGADVNMQLEHGHYGSALVAAAADGSPGIIRALLEGGADVNMQLEHGEYGSALAAAGSQFAVDELLQGGADVNMDIKYGSYRNALAAALHKKRNTVESLLRAGAIIGPFSSTQIKRSGPVTKWINGEAPMIRKFIIGWELPSIMEGVEDMETRLSNMGTLTRKFDTVMLASCNYFLRNSYGDFGMTLLQGIVRALKSSENFYLDGNVEIRTAPLEVSVRTTDMTPNALRILEWICLTFRKPIEHALSSSTINRSGIWSFLGELLPFRESPKNTHTTQCWCQLFDSGVVASEPSIESRTHCRGLELDFKNLLRISAVEYPVLVESGIILMGYSTALIPIELTEDGKIMWHLEVAKDDFQLQICHIKATKKKWLRDRRLDYLQAQTALLGWCSDAEVLLGTSRLKLNVTLSDAKSKPISWRWGGANLQLVAQSASPLALGGQLGFTFDRCTNTLQFNPSNNYLKCLSNSARQHIVLYDVTAKRAWLVSLLSVLHHMLLVWSERIYEGFKKASPPTATPGPDCGLASFNALRDQGGFVLDSSGTDMTTLRDLIMGFSVNMSKAALHAPKGSKIYGYEFLDIVTESPDSQLKKTKLEKQGLGWASLMNEFKCLFCSNLGDVIVGKRSNLALSPCNTLVEGYDLMAVSVHSIKTLSEKYGGKTHGSTCRLSQTHFWNLAGSPFRSCQHTHNDGSCWNRPELLGEILQEIRGQPPEHPNPQNGASFLKGALVFGGQSRTFFHRAKSTETNAISIRGMVT